jgi:Fe-Mn family superoxide dismutase
MFELPDLPYDYDALDPYVSADIMRLHHDGHHKTYTANLNKLVETDDNLKGLSIEEMLVKVATAPADKQQAIKNQAGGYYNHGLFWEMMSPKGGEPTGDLLDAIRDDFGDFGSFREQFTAGANKVFGSGWQWLVYNNGKLELMMTPNQDCPLTEGKTPLMALDLWEHAYYLQYYSKRVDYVEAWWNIVNWDEAARRLAEAKA